jgi:5S rRNA maturation endonuclease (ribonuclease M5)
MSDRKTSYDVEAIKAANPLAEFLAGRGFVLKRHGALLQGKCPFHHEQNGEALTVYEQENRWHCFGKCSAGGDVIRAVELLDGLDFKGACERLGGRLPEDALPARTELPKKPKIEPLTAGQVIMQSAAAKALGADEGRCAGIAKRRGWLAETVRGLALDAHLGTHESKLGFIYPHGLKLRWQDAAGERRIAWVFGSNGELWRQDRLASSSVRTVYVCEGETDGISLLDAGMETDSTVAVVAIPGASCWRQEWNALFAGRDVLVATDADDAGEKAAKRIVGELDGVAARVARINPLALLPEDRREGVKDIGDCHERLGRDDLRVAVESAATVALESATVTKQESAKSTECPQVAGGFADYADYVSEETPQDEPFPLDCLPAAAGDMAREVSRSALVPEVLAGMNVIGLLSAAIGAGLEVNSGGDRRTRANVFLMPVAASGTGKGQSFGAIAEPFLQREAERLAEWQRVDRPQARADKAVAEARMARLTTDAKKPLKPEEKASLLSELAEVHGDIDRAERCMHEPAWSTEQATKEAIESLFAISTRETLASLSAEARGAVDVLMGRYREATDEGIFLAGYSGDPVKIHRKGSPPVVLAHPCLTVLWMLQPDKLRELLESAAMSESGMMPRFLIADTKAEPQEEPDERHCIPASVKSAWTELIHSLLEEYHEPDAKARVVQPVREAAAMLRDYTNEIVQRRKRGGDLEDVSIYAARWAENAWRLAVVLHAAENGEDAWRENLSVATAGKALTLMRWFAAQQLRLLASGREDNLAKRLEKLREVLALKPEKVCNLSELERRHAFAADEVQRLAAQFPGVVVIEKLSTGGSGRPPVVARLLPEPKQQR